MSPRRQLIAGVFKTADLSAMLTAFAIGTGVVYFESDWPSLTELLTARLKVANFVLLVGLLLLWHLIFSTLGLYHSQRYSSRYAEIWKIFKATSVGSLGIFNAGILMNVTLITPLFVLTFWTSSTALTIACRLILRAVLEYARIHGRNLRYVLVVGSNDRALGFARKIRTKPELGYRIAGFVDDDWHGAAGVREAGESLVAGIDDLPGYLRSQVVDEVVIALPARSCYEQAARIVRVCEEQGVTVRFLTNIFNHSLSRATVEVFEDEPVITLQTNTMDGWPGLVKNATDRVIAFVLLTVSLPLLLAVAALVKMTSSGPVLFVQERVGFAKRKFRLYKFRTMVVDAEQQLRKIEHLNEVSGPVFKIKNDPRLTGIGRFLRKSSIDELPQLINVLRGDMSLVGPRPLPVRDFDGFDKDWHRRRFSVRPGVTCLWQIRGRSSVTFEEWMKLDMEYIDRWNLWLDFKILLLTIPAVVKGSGAA